MFIGREEDVELAVSLVRSGMSVDVVGSRGSGRTTFLQAFRLRMEELGWAIVQIRGIAAFRSNPLAAISIAGYGNSPGNRSSTSLSDSISLINSATRSRSTVLLLDDWDDLDEASWGVADAVRRLSSVPIVVSHLRGRRSRHAPTGTIGISSEPSYVIELDPLGFESIERILTARLGGPSDIGTVSRIFSKSGGIPGLALSIVDIGVRETRIVKRSDGRWVALEQLWSPGLRSVIEAHLEGLDSSAHDAIWILALLGVADIDIVRDFINWTTLEMLEERGLVQIDSSGRQQRVTITPPLIVDYVRNERLTARKIRLTDRIVASIGSDNPLSIVAASQGSRAMGDTQNNAVFSRMLHERVRAQGILTGETWENSNGPGEAVAHLRALLQSAAPKDAIDRVFRKTDMTRGNDQEVTEFTVLRAKWLAYVHGKLDDSLALLIPVSHAPHDRELVFAAAQVQILTNLSTVPEAQLAKLDQQQAKSSYAALALLETRMYVAVVQGRFKHACIIYRAIDELDPEQLHHMPRALYAYALVGEGKLPEALAITRTGMDSAHERLDLDAMRAYCSAAALCHLFVGNFDAVDRILDTLLATGDSYSLPRGHYISVLNIASVVAYRRGDLVLGERYVNELSSLALPDGPLPAQAASWSRAQKFSAGGNPSTAADIHWNSAEILWERKAYFAATLGYISSLELLPSQERYAHCRPRLETMEGDFLHSATTYIRALVEEDADLLLKSSQDLQRVGRFGYSLSALRAAKRLYLAEGKTENAEQAGIEEETMLSSQGGRLYDSARFSTATISLSQREREVAGLAADGLSNTEIATMLVLSVRTVESHMGRILRKLGLTKRTELTGIRTQFSDA